MALTPQQKSSILRGGGALAQLLTVGLIDVNDPDTSEWLRVNLPWSSYQLVLAACRCPTSICRPTTTNSGNVVVAPPGALNVVPGSVPVFVPGQTPYQSAPYAGQPLAARPGSPAPPGFRDFRTLNTQQRITTALSALTAAGVPKRYAQWVVADTGMEDKYQWVTADRLGILASGQPRIPVGLEHREGILQSVWDNNKSRQLLLDLGVVGGPDQTGTTAMHWADKVLSGDGDNEWITRIFENALHFQIPELLAHFSVGPTQMFMFYSQMYIPILRAHGDNITHWRPGWPSSWQDLYNMYLTGDIARYFSERISKYLPPPPAGDSETEAIEWLIHETGSKKYAVPYYHGDKPFANSGGWKGKYQMVMSVGGLRT
jgi:hypothetical protein